MIKRKVFIVRGYSKSKDELDLDKYYVKAYAQFFESTVGGAYFVNEILHLEEPSCVDLEKQFCEESLDFGIIIYIGHGANQNDNQIFQLNSIEIIKAGQFTLKSEKQIIILESCRVLSEDVPTVDLADKIPKFEKGGIVRWALTKEQSREIYDSHIKRCEPEIMICYGCEKGQGSHNFIFSQQLLQHAMDWHLDSSRHCAILPADELMRLLWVDVIVKAREIGVSQRPTSQGSTNFPIAVSKF